MLLLDEVCLTKFEKAFPPGPQASDSPPFISVLYR